MRAALKLHGESGLLLVLAGLLMLTPLSGCNATADSNRSAVLAVLSNINGGEPLNSDVRDDTTGSVNDDQVTLEIQTFEKSSVGGTSDLYTVQFLQASILFTRPDGFNEPGVDVPFPLTQGISVAVAPGGTSQVTLTVVTNQAKLEPPLRNLWFGGGELEIQATATIELRGQDLAGNAVTAVGNMPVFFADFAG